MFLVWPSYLSFSFSFTTLSLYYTSFESAFLIPTLPEASLGSWPTSFQTRDWDFGALSLSAVTRDKGPVKFAGID